MRITNAGNVGIGTTTPQVALDVNGQVRLAKSGAAPFTCDANHDGTIVLTNRYTMCVCKTNAWVSTTDGLTACVFN